MAQAFKLYIETKVVNKHGKIVSKRRRASHSFTLQFLGMIEAMMRGQAAGGTQVRDITNTLFGFMDNTSTFGAILNVNGPDDSDVYGIIVGTGSTAPTNADHVIETKIAHGVGAGQLDYNAVGFVAAAVVGPNVDFKITRSFVNSSGGSITVEEVALYEASVEVNAVLKYLCIIRDVTGGVAVADGNTLTVTYTLRTTV